MKFESGGGCFLVGSEMDSFAKGQMIDGKCVEGKLGPREDARRSPRSTVGVAVATGSSSHD